MPLSSCLIDLSKATSTKIKGSKRSISIDEDKNQVFEYDAPDAELEVLFFTADEFILMKAKSREEARAWRRKGLGVLLKESFDMSYSDTQLFLNAFTQLDEDLYRRGLERHLSRQLAEERSDRKDCARQAVFIQQEELQRQGMKRNEILQRIADVYQDQSRQAKVFARKIAIADEHVVVNGEDSSVAARIVEKSKSGRKSRRMERRSSTSSTLSWGSTESNFSAMSSNSFDSWRQQQDCPSFQREKVIQGSPTSPVEYYAAIA